MNSSPHRTTRSGICLNCGGVGGKPGPCPAAGAASPADAAKRIKELGNHYINQMDSGKTPTDDEMRAALKTIVGDHSPHEVAKAIGYASKFKTAADAHKAIEREVIGRVGTYARAGA